MSYFRAWCQHYSDTGGAEHEILRSSRFHRNPPRVAAQASWTQLLAWRCRR